MKPDFALNLARPPLQAGVTYESWDPFTSGADPLHPGWYGDPNEWATGVLASLMLGPDAAMRVSVVNRCVNLRASTLASLPCRLVEELGEDRTELRPDHRADLAVRRKPNAWQTRFQFFRDMQAKHDLHGRAFARVRDNGRTITMTPLDPERVRIQQLTDEQLRFIYAPPVGAPQTILQEEMLYLRDISEDFTTGQARAVLAREAIAVSRAAEAFVSRFFVNDASGRVMFSHPGKFESGQKRDEFMAFLRREIMGAWNAHKPMLGYGGLEAKPISMTADKDFMVTPRTFQAADIARFWGCPGVLIGLEEKTSSWGTGVWEIKQGFVDFTIKPEAINWQESLEQALLDEEEGERLSFRFNFRDLLRANPTDQATVDKTYVEIGALSPNDVRRDSLQMNPREGGDDYQRNVPGAAPNDPTGAGALDGADGQSRIDADGNMVSEELGVIIESYGVAVRAGVVTPQPEDEGYFRDKMRLPPASRAVGDAWSKDKVRRPITLKDATDPKAPQPTGPVEEEPEATPREQAAGIPRPLLADAAERIAAASARGGKAKWMDYATKAIAPLVTGFGLPESVIATVADRIAAVIPDTTHEERRDRILAVLDDLLTPAVGRKVAA